MNTALFWAKAISFLNKVFPWIVAFAAYMKGKAAVREEINIENLKKEKEYAEIDASKPDTVDDDISRMREGTF
jgi:hypothetical protein